MDTRSPTRQANSSITALTVAAGALRAMSDGYREGWFTPDEEKFLLRMIETALAREKSKFKYYLGRTMFATPNSWQSALMNSLFAGYDTHMVTRKLLIRDHIRHCVLKEGIRQVVNLGGGCDMGLLVASVELRASNVTFIEIDRGETRQHKMACIDEIANSSEYADKYKFHILPDGTGCINQNLYYIDCDLGEVPLAEALQHGQFDSNKKTLFIAEGVTMYLTSQQLDSLFRQIGGITQDGSQFLLSFVPTLNDPSRFAAFARSMNKEDYGSAFLHEEVCEYVNHRQFRVSAVADRNLFARQAADPALLVDMENHPEGALETYYLLSKDSMFGPDQPIQNIRDVPAMQFTTPAKESDPRLKGSGICVIA